MYLNYILFVLFSQQVPHEQRGGVTSENCYGKRTGRIPEIDRIDHLQVSLNG
jgi:hypothetical protein